MASACVSARASVAARQRAGPAQKAHRDSLCPCRGGADEDATSWADFFFSELHKKAHVVFKKRTSLGVKGRGQRQLRGPGCVEPMTNYSAQYLVKYVVLLAAGRAV